jgi:guanylate kinase
MIFILPPSQADLAGRMAGRGRGEDGKTARRRLDGAGTEIAAAWQYYDHMVINENVGQAVKEIKLIIEENIGAEQ